MTAQLPGPLRSLILHAMAGEPAERPRSGAALRAELGTTATSAYGATWKDDGTGMLRGRAAALLALLLPGPAAASGGTGSTAVTTTLAPKAAIASRAGLSGWQFAAACAAVFVVVFGAVAGAVVGVGGLAGSRHPAGGGPGSAKPPAAAPGSAACGSPGAPLAYVTFTGTAQIPTGGSVVVRCGTGTPRTLESFGLTQYGRPSLAWSSDGTQLAWLTGSDLHVARASAGTWSVRHWACRCAGLAFRGQQAVTVSSQAAGGPFATAIPQLLVFPATGPGQPTTLPVTGITTTTGPGTGFQVLGSVSPAGLVVTYGIVGGTVRGNPVLYRVNAAGQATQYQHQPPLSPA